MPNRAIVLSGGGSKGAFQVGALDYLVNDRGLDFQVYAGVSTGSLNATVLAQGEGHEGLQAQLETLKALWFGIRSERDVYTKRFLGEILVFLTKDSVYDPAPLWEKLRRHVDPERLRGSGNELRVGATSLPSGDYVAVTQKAASLREWTLASASIPVLFPPVHVGEERAVDGGVRNVTPLEDAFRALKSLPSSSGPERDEVYIVLASTPEVETTSGPWKDGRKIGARALSLLMNEILREDIGYALAINEAVGFFEAVQDGLKPRMSPREWDRFLEAHPFRYRPPQYRRVDVRAVLPDREYSGDLEFDPAKIREAFQAGREAARRPLTNDDLAERLDARAPRREEPPAGSSIAGVVGSHPAHPARPRRSRPAA